MAASVPSMEDSPEENLEEGEVGAQNDDEDQLSEGVGGSPHEAGAQDEGPVDQVHQNDPQSDGEAELHEEVEEEEEEETGREGDAGEHEDEEMEIDDGEVRRNETDEHPEGLQPETDDVDDEEEEDEEEDEGPHHGPGGGQNEKNQDEDEVEEDEEESNNNGRTVEEVNLRKRSASGSDEAGPTKRQFRGESTSPGHDQFCWVCHKEGVQVHCKICPRSYHLKCRHLPDEPAPKGQAALDPPAAPKSYICPECAVVMNAENLETRLDSDTQFGTFICLVLLQLTWCLL